LLALFYDWVVPLAPQNVVEVGVVGGGAAALLMEWFQPAKLCLIDIELDRHRRCHYAKF